MKGKDKVNGADREYGVGVGWRGGEMGSLTFIPGERKAENPGRPKESEIGYGLKVILLAKLEIQIEI
jgi:hypothetical protein